MTSPFHLFEVFGIEIELMVVAQDGLCVQPAAPDALAAAAGPGASDFTDGPVSWSNELVAHVLEFKTSEPTPALAELPQAFHRSMMRCDELLHGVGAMLLPGAAHPWMDPRQETTLWPHEGHEIYATYHRLFDCHRHGWANLQSVHLNLPFADDEEFARLHAACRVVMCLLPGLSAASPLQEGRWLGAMDQRLRTYAANSVLVPRMTGPVVPEAVNDEASYRRVIMEPLSADVRRLDPSGTLQGDWLNARGVIARFDRMALEIRVIDAQECPLADLGVAAAAVAACRRLVDAPGIAPADLRALSPARLRATFAATVMDGSASQLVDPLLLQAFGHAADRPLPLREFWAGILEGMPSAPWGPWSEAYLRGGSLAERMVQQVGLTPTREQLAELLRQQRRCLVENRPLQP